MVTIVVYEDAGGLTQTFCHPDEDPDTGSLAMDTFLDSDDGMKSLRENSRAVIREELVEVAPAGFTVLDVIPVIHDTCYTPFVKHETGVIGLFDPPLEISAGVFVS